MEPAAALAARLGLTLPDLSLLAQALVHGSYTNEHPDSGVESNARLEFLGDAVVSLIVSQALYERHPDEDEGALTARRSALVSRAGLARLADKIELGEYVVLGQGAERSGERRRSSVLAATFEAVAGAIYLELGLEVVRAWILDLVSEDLVAGAPLTSLKSPKSRLQELSYGRWGSAPEYRLVAADGPDHARHFQVEVEVNGVVAGHGAGANRRDAETAAAAEALASLAAEEAGTDVPAAASRDARP
jgi:ribonuclease III